MTTGFILTSEVAAAYFDLCLMREAVTEKERVDILKELCAVGKAQAFSTSSTKEEVIEYRIKRFVVRGQIILIPVVASMENKNDSRK
jgi:predicted metal-dependent RNase